MVDALWHKAPDNKGKEGTSHKGEKEEVKGGRMVKGVLMLPRLQSHRWLTRRRWSIWIIKIKYTMPHMVVVPILDQDDIAVSELSASLSWRTGRYIFVGLLCQPCALPLWYNSNNVSVIFNCLKLSYATQFKCFNFFYMCFCLNIKSTFNYFL